MLPLAWIINRQSPWERRVRRKSQLISIDLNLMSTQFVPGFLLLFCFVFFNFHFWFCCFFFFLNAASLGMPRVLLLWGRRRPPVKWRLLSKLIKILRHLPTDHALQPQQQKGNSISISGKNCKKLCKQKTLPNDQRQQQQQKQQTQTKAALA